jgi:hypothetical protein
VPPSPMSFPQDSHSFKTPLSLPPSLSLPIPQPVDHTVATEKGPKRFRGRAL